MEFLLPQGRRSACPILGWGTLMVVGTGRGDEGAQLRDVTKIEGTKVGAKSCMFSQGLVWVQGYTCSLAGRRQQVESEALYGTEASEAWTSSIS